MVKSFLASWWISDSTVSIDSIYIPRNVKFDTQTASWSRGLRLSAASQPTKQLTEQADSDWPQAYWTDVEDIQLNCNMEAFAVH